MLARLRDERFLLFQKQDLIDVGLPYSWRKQTKDWLLAEIAKNPLKPIQDPIYPKHISVYFDQVRMYRRESISHLNRLKSVRKKAKATPALEEARGMFDPPVKGGGEQAEVEFHKRMIKMYHESASTQFGKLTTEDLMWVGEVPIISRWAGDLPLEQPYPFNQWAPKFPPHKIRQVTMLEWAVDQCTAKYGLQERDNDFPLM